jgi:hypothetical protein
MATLNNTRISDTYFGLIKTIDNAVISATLKELSDGSGNATGLSINNAGDFKVNSVLEFGSLKDTGENIVISKFVDAADGIGNNNNDTSIPTSAAVVSYVAAQITAEDLDFTGDDAAVSGDVDLNSEQFRILGTANEIETTVVSAGGNQLKIGIVNNPTLTGIVTATTFSGDLNGTINTATTGVTQSAGDNSTKIATTAYVDSLDAASDLDFSGDSGTGAVILNTQTFAITGTTNQITTSASGVGLSLSLPNTIHRNLQGNVTGNLTGNVTGNVSGDLTGNVTGTSVLANGVTATTQSTGDNSTKVATTAYVDSLDAASDLDFAGDSGTTGAVVLNTESLAIVGTANEVETSASNQQLQIGLPSSINVNSASATILQNARDISLTGQATATISSFNGSTNVSGAVTLDNDSVTGKVLTGLASPTASNILASDSILQAFGKAQSQINTLAGGLRFMGTWNATTNTPTLASGGGEADSGTTTGTATNKLIQSGQNFTSSVTNGDKVINQASGATALVTNVDSNTQLTLDADIMVSGQEYTIDNSPFITQGHYFVVSVGGTSSLNGLSNWAVGDWVIAGAGNVWEKLDHTQVDGTGTAGNITKWSSTNVIADSIMAESGSTISVTGSLSTSQLLSSGGNFAVNTNKFTVDATTGNVVTTGDVSLADSKQLKLGNSADLLIFHDGADSYIKDTGSGLLFIRASSALRIQGANGESMIDANENGAVNLYYDNSIKLATTSTGITISNVGATSAASSTVDEFKVGSFGAGRPAIFFGTANSTYTNSTWFIENRGADGKLVIGRNGLDAINILNSGDFGIGASPSDGNLQVKKAGVNTGITNVLMNASFSEAGGSLSGLSIGYRTDETTAVLAARTATGNISFMSYNGGWSESFRIAYTGISTFTNNVKIADEKVFGLRTSSNDYALQYRDLDFRLIGSSDGTTQRKFSFGYYTSDNPAGTWNGKTYINSYTGQTVIGNTSLPADHMLQISNPGQSFARFALTNSQTGNATGDGLKFQMENLNAIIKNQEAGYLALGVNGRETDIRIVDGGKVGINYGSTAPYRLSVKEDSTAATNIGVYSLVNGAGTNNYAFYADANSGTSTNFGFYGNSGNNAFLGSVAIGNDNPVSKFDVYGNVQNDTTSIANSAAYIRGADVGVAIGQSASSPYGTWMQSQRNSDGVAFPLALNPSGAFVGISTAAPRGSLEINRAAGLSSYPQIVISTGEANSSDYSLSTDVTSAGDFCIVKGAANVAGNVRLKIDAAGDIGIGSNDPRNKLTVVTAGSAVSETALRLVNPIGFTSAGAGSRIAFAQDRNDGENFEMAAISSSQHVAGSSSNGELTFFTRLSSALSEKMRIGASGQVTITNALDYSLKLARTTAYDSGGNAGIVFNGLYNSGGSSTDMASIRGGKQNTIDGDFGGKLTFHTRTNGGVDTERMQLNSKGVLELKSNNTNQASFEQTLAIRRGLSAAGTVLPIAYVDHTHALDITVIVKQDTANVATGVGRSVCAYGAANTGLDVVQTSSGNITGLTLAYLNTNPSGQDYVLTLTWAGSGASPDAYITIRGNSTAAICEY